MKDQVYYMLSINEVDSEILKLSPQNEKSGIDKSKTNNKYYLQKQNIPMKENAFVPRNKVDCKISGSIFSK